MLHKRINGLILDAKLVFLLHETWIWLMATPIHATHGGKLFGLCYNLVFKPTQIAHPIIANIMLATHHALSHCVRTIHQYLHVGFHMLTCVLRSSGLQIKQTQVTTLPQGQEIQNFDTK